MLAAQSEGSLLVGAGKMGSCFKIRVMEAFGAISGKNY